MAIDDNSALTVLLARYMQALELRELEQKVVSDANLRIKEHNTRVSNLRSAFAAFGHDTAADDVWKHVRDQIGGAAYSQALEDGRHALNDITYSTLATTGSGHSFEAKLIISHRAGEALPAVQDSASESMEDTGATTTSGEASAQEFDGTASQKEERDAGVNASASTTAEGDAPRVKDVVLERLQLSFPNGLRASDLRQYYDTAFLTTLHEKTIGMTLYRLSKDELVRREGRLWFYVPPKGETKNPGGGTPGLVELVN
jgi:hypothetical protein